jgi:Plasmid pRiA4b ORF-3-like protein
MVRKKTGKTGKSQGKQIFQFRVELEDTSPVVWRSFQVPHAISFYELHEVLQVVMGWMNSHLFMFRGDDLTITEAGEEDLWEDGEFRDAHEVKLHEVISVPKDSIVYRYDFGDSWEHTLTLEKTLTEEDVQFTIPRCLDGANACPPEDCGGVPGFERIKEILSNTKDDEYLDTVEWLDHYYPNYHPNEFSLGNINRVLKIGASKYFRAMQRLYS